MRRPLRVNMIKNKLFFTPSTDSLFRSSPGLVGFIKLYQIQSFSPTSKSVCVQCTPSHPPTYTHTHTHAHTLSVRLFFLGPVTRSRCVTPTVSNWQCSKSSPTLCADIALFSCLMLCSSTVYQAEVLTCCPVSSVPDAGGPSLIQG